MPCPPRLACAPTGAALLFGGEAATAAVGSASAAHPWRSPAAPALAPAEEPASVPGAAAAKRLRLLLAGPPVACHGRPPAPAGMLPPLLKPGGGGGGPLPPALGLSLNPGGGPKPRAFEGGCIGALLAGVNPGGGAIGGGGGGGGSEGGASSSSSGGAA